MVVDGNCYSIIGKYRLSFSKGGIQDYESSKKKITDRNAGKVIELKDFRNQKNDSILQELLIAVPEEYRRDYEESPLLRLLLKYDGMNEENKERIFSFTEKMIAEKRGRRLNKRNIFSDMLAWGDEATWDTIEKVADNLLVRDRG